mgnify:CR=1 FL=1
MTPGTPFLCYIIGVIIAIIVGWFSRCCKKDTGEIAVADLTVIENLSHFFSMLKNKDREFWFREETVCRDRIGLKRISNKKNFETLVFADADRLKRRLRSVHNYDILTNPIYSDRFHYVPGAYPTRSDYIISEFNDPWIQNYSTDIVRLACDIAYLPRSLAKKIQFDEGHIFQAMVDLKIQHLEAGVD